MSLIINGPRILRRSGSRGEAGNQNVKAFPSKAVTRKGSGVGNVAEPQGSPLEQVGAAGWRKRAAYPCARPHEAHSLVTALQQRANGRPADGAGCA